MGSKQDKYYAEKVLFEIEAIIKYTSGMLFEEFMSDVKTIDATMLGFNKWLNILKKFL